MNRIVYLDNTSTTGSYGLENGALRRIDVNFVDIDVPETLELALQVYDSTDRWEPGAEPVVCAILNARRGQVYGKIEGWLPGCPCMLTDVLEIIKSAILSSG